MMSADNNDITGEKLPATLWAALKLYLRPFWRQLAVIQLCAFAWPLDGLLFPFFIGKIIDAITTAGASREELLQHAMPWIIGYFLLWPITEVGYRMAGFLSGNTGPRIRAHIQTDLYRRIQRQDYSFLIDHQGGDLLTKLRDVSDGVIRIFNEAVWQFNNAILMIVVSMVILLFIQPVFALIVGLTAVCFLIVARYSNSIIEKQSAKTAQARAALSGRLVDSFGNFLALRVFGAGRHELHSYGLLQEDERREIRNGVYLTEKVRLVYGAMAFLFAGFLLNGGALYGWYHGWITPGDIVLINGMVVTILQRLWFLCGDLPDVMNAAGSARQALELLSREPTITDKPGAQALIPNGGAITLNNVQFGYDNVAPLFNGLSIDIPAGQKVGLVGYSGSGKSTLVRLLMRLYDVKGGAITIDGQDIAGVTQDSLRSTISFIPQEPELFHRTVAENIGIGKDGATRDDIIEASKRAHAHEFISALPQGYDSVVGERGVKLSGGQRQRIAIARAALRQTPILIMDEATSALDSMTERYVQNSLHSLMQGRTTLVIAHRLSTLLDMDRILVFDHGRLVQDGDVQALQNQPGIFKTLWDAQVGGFLPDKPAEA